MASGLQAGKQHAERLVVDTGLHAKRWTRQQAIDFMLAQTSLSAHNIEREVDLGGALHSEVNERSDADLVALLL